MNNIVINPPPEQWTGILKRPAFDSKALELAVSPILEDVRLNGDAAVRKYASKFDQVDLQDMMVSREEMEAASSKVSADLKSAILKARANIEKFHAAQALGPEQVETSTGIRCWRTALPIEKVGLYIPGGTAPLFSTLLMLAIPARLAGCKHIAVCTPCDKEGNVNPVILHVANITGITTVYKIGGVQAIAAMAYGTASIERVYKIFGPGNQYVTCAKQLVNKEGVAIDMPAGPSEVAVYADESSIPAFVAADLLSQAEHGIDSQVILVSATLTMANSVREEVARQLPLLPRKDIAAKALENGRFIVLEQVDEAFKLINEYAPEHLILASDNALQLSKKVMNAGSVFLGHYAPESLGDYAAGTNHTLPTNGHAKAYSGVSLDSFVKKITFQQVSIEGIRDIGATVEIMAAAESLDAHKNAVTIRLLALDGISGPAAGSILAEDG